MREVYYFFLGLRRLKGAGFLGGVVFFFESTWRAAALLALGFTEAGLRLVEGLDTLAVVFALALAFGLAFAFAAVLAFALGVAAYESDGTATLKHNAIKKILTGLIVFLSTGPMAFLTQT
jgi:hypothetical protein